MQVDLASNPDRVTHTSNRIIYQKLFSCWTIGEVSVLPPPTNLLIVVIELAPQTLLTPTVQELSVDAAEATCRQVGFCEKSAGLALTDPLQFPPKFTVELAKIPPQFPVTVLETGLPLGIVAPVLPYTLDVSGSLGLGINGNPHPQIS